MASQIISIESKLSKIPNIIFTKTNRGNLVHKFYTPNFDYQNSEEKHKLEHILCNVCKLLSTEEKEIIALLEYIEENSDEINPHFPVHEDKSLKSGVEKGLYSQERLDNAIFACENNVALKKLILIEKNPDLWSAYIPTSDDIALNLGIERKLFSRERVEKAIEIYQQTKKIDFCTYE